jgi:small subunit ribosomal protein S6
VREFETTIIVQPEISEEGREALLNKLGELLGRGGATRLEVEDHGKRKLAYDIRKFQKGHYLTVHFLDGGGNVPPLERALRLEESVLRYLTIRVADEVADVEARKVRAGELEQTRRERAAERAAREAEERAAREAEERERVDAAEEVAAGDSEDEDGREGQSEDE